MTYIDLRKAWIEAAFRENSIERMKLGDPVEIALDIKPGTIIRGKIAAFGLAGGNRSVGASREHLVRDEGINLNWSQRPI